MATITMKTISQLDNNSGHACTWDAYGLFGVRERELQLDVGSADVRLVNGATETAGYQYGRGARQRLNPGAANGVFLPAPEPGDEAELLLFANEAADPTPFVTLKLTKKTGG
ncbi:MAG: hypothetical protein R3A79_26185 [Nannocystaceae bacterium]